MSGINGQLSYEITENRAVSATAGDAYIDIVGHYNMTNSLTIHFGIKNLTDRDYVDHLGAYNRVNYTDIAPMSRILSIARDIWLNGSLNF